MLLANNVLFSISVKSRPLGAPPYVYFLPQFPLSIDLSAFGKLSKGAASSFLYLRGINLDSV